MEAVGSGPMARGRAAARSPTRPKRVRRSRDLVAVLQRSPRRASRRGHRSRPACGRDSWSRATAPNTLEVAAALEALAMWLWYSGDYEGERTHRRARPRPSRTHAAPPDDVGIARDFHFLSDTLPRRGGLRSRAAVSRARGPTRRASVRPGQRTYWRFTCTTSPSSKRAIGDQRRRHRQRAAGRRHSREAPPRPDSDSGPEPQSPRRPAGRRR